jgi:hypothetical protein
VRHHHAEGLLDTQVKGAVHALCNMATQSTETTRHRTPSLRLALLDPLARLKGGSLQLFQLLLRRIVGRLDDLLLGC